MRHSDIQLTMGTYTDARLLDTQSAVESIPVLRPVAPAVAPNPAILGTIGHFRPKTERTLASHIVQKPCNS